VPREFDGLVAAVTGGGSGIGLATVRLLAARGARAAALDLYPSAAAESVEGAEGPLPLVADVTDETSVEAAIAAVAVGGTPLTGGRATIVGTLIGALILQLLRFTLLSHGVPDAVALVVQAVIIVAAVFLQRQRQT